MAAVAAEPGAASVRTAAIAASADGEAPPDLGPTAPGPAATQPESGEPGEHRPALGSPRMEDGGEGEARRHVGPEPDPAGRASSDAPAGDDPACNHHVQAGYRSIPSDPQPPAVFLHSFPAPPAATEAGLSLAEPAEPTTNVTTDRGTEELLRDSAPPCRSPKRRLVSDVHPPADGRFGPGPGPDLGAQPVGSVQDLSPGTEVRVSLDHVIDDALVVSFCVGEKVFSGVLMDVSKR